MFLLTVTTKLPVHANLPSRLWNKPSSKRANGEDCNHPKQPEAHKALALIEGRPINEPFETFPVQLQVRNSTAKPRTAPLL